MRRVEATTLEAAYQKASELLACSVSELQCEVVQHPSSGILGFFKKTAIIVAVRKSGTGSDSAGGLSEYSAEESVASEIIAVVKKEEASDIRQKEHSKTNTGKKKVSKTDHHHAEPQFENDAIVERFFEADTTQDRVEEEEVFKEETIVYDELARVIEAQIEELLACSCFDIDVVEVDVIDNTALIFIDGEDAALLIGKEGYRYNALSYMLFNWLHSKYELFIKLEIAEFLTTQQEMIRVYLQPLIETVERTGRGKTRFLDGILVQIALEQLRERFPDKYVAVKSTKGGKKFVVVNEFKSNVS